MHRHKYTLLSFNYKSLVFRCSCGLTQEREPTTQEKKEIKAHLKKTMDHCEAIHKLYHSFVKKFKKEIGSISASPVWRLHGDTLMRQVEKWAKKHPSVTITRCDDILYAGARLVFIPHETKDEYFGTTVVYLSQFCEPAEFFLYPCHVEEMLPIFKEMMKKSAKKLKPESLGFKLKFP